ncbi:hypothetical protein [Winogradskyella psychrotolerans]|nr:hypothetical protein [Winogradskyella psychrotolerans]
MGLDAGVIEGADMAIFEKIRDHELAHVNF